MELVNRFLDFQFLGAVPQGGVRLESLTYGAIELVNRWRILRFGPAGFGCELVNRLPVFQFCGGLRRSGVRLESLTYGAIELVNRFLDFRFRLHRSVILYVGRGNGNPISNSRWHGIGGKLCNGIDGVSDGAFQLARGFEDQVAIGGEDDAIE